MEFDSIMMPASKSAELFSLKKQAKQLSLSLQEALPGADSVRIELLEVLDRLVLLDPDDVKTHHQQAQSLLELGQNERAGDVIAELIRRWPQSPKGYEVAFAFAQATEVSCDMLEHIVDQAIRHSKTAPKFRLGVLKALDALRAPNDALLPRLAAKWPDRYQSLSKDNAKIAANLILMSRRQHKLLVSRTAFGKDDAENRALVSSLERLVAIDPERPNHQARLAQLLALMGQTERARKTARHLIEKWPTDPISHTTAFKVAMDTKMSAPEAAQIIEAAVIHSSAAPQFEKFFVQHLQLPKAETARLIELLCKTWPNTYGGQFGTERPADTQVDSIALLAMQDRARARIEAESMIHPQARTATGENLLPGLVEAMPQADALLRPLIEDDGREVIVSAPGSSGTTVLFFAGGAHKLGLAFDVVDAFCARHGASAIYCRDHSNNTFFGGIPSLGPTKEDATVFLAARLQELDTRRLVIVTSSGGCLGGAACSLPLRPARAIFVAPMTELSVERLSKAGFPPATIALAERFISAAPAELLDLRRQLASYPEHIDIAISYGAECKNDVDQAERMRDVAGVTLMPVPNCNTHGTMTQLIVSGDLERLLFS